MKKYAVASFATLLAVSAFVYGITSARVQNPSSTSDAITSLNSQTGTTQTFASSSAGTNFGVSSTGDVHTFNFPNFLAGVTTTSTAKTAWGIQNDFAYAASTSTQKDAGGFNDSAYRDAAGTPADVQVFATST